MKYLLTLVPLIFAFSFNSKATSLEPPPPTQALCMESGQKTAFIVAEIFENHGTVIVKHMDIEGNVSKKEELMGAPPELNIIKANTAGEEELIIVSAMSVGATGATARVLVCSPSRITP